MIFYKNKKKYKPVEQKNLIFSVFENGLVSNKDDSVASPTQCKTFYNLSFTDGALKTGLGFKDFQVPSSIDDLKNCHSYNFAECIDEIDGIWLDRFFSDSIEAYYYQLLLMDSKFNVWCVPLIDDDDGFILKKSQRVKSFPTYQCAYRIDNKDCCLFFTEQGMIFLTGYSEGSYPDVPPIISCVVHYDNFFGVTNTNRNTLIYTTNLNLKEWSESDRSTIEFLDNRGSFNKLVGFNDYVYLFREYGITRISLYTSSKDFAFTHLFTSSSKIFENSVCVCDDQILFVTRDGLFSFNGNSVTKVAKNLDKFLKKLDNANCTCACLDGKYYLATYCDFDDGEKIGCENEQCVNNVLFEIDIHDFTFNMIRGVDIKKVLTIDTPFMNKLLACFNGQNKQRVGELDHSGSVFESKNKKSWSSFQTDFGFTGKVKKIKEIVLTTLYDLSVEIKSDIESTILKFSGSKTEQRMRLNVKGKVFQINFTTSESCDVKKPMIVFDVEK